MPLGTQFIDIVHHPYLASTFKEQVLECVLWHWLEFRIFNTLFTRWQQIVFCFQYYIATASIILQLAVLYWKK